MQWLGLGDLLQVLHLRLGSWRKVLCRVCKQRELQATRVAAAAVLLLAVPLPRLLQAGVQVQVQVSAPVPTQQMQQQTVLTHTHMQPPPSHQCTKPAGQPQQQQPHVQHVQQQVVAAGPEDRRIR